MEQHINNPPGSPKVGEPGNANVGDPGSPKVGDPGTGVAAGPVTAGAAAPGSPTTHMDVDNPEKIGKETDGRGDIADVQIIKKEDPEESLFVAEPDGNADFDEDERPLYVRHTPKPNGLVETVGWGKARRGIFFIIATARKYEERTKNDEDPHKYTKRHIIGVWGVAWECPDGCAHDLDLINPDVGTGRWPATFVLVMWDIDGEQKKAWETRTTLRNRWTKKGADAAIYAAACEAEDRYIEATTGTRPATRISAPSR
ncbi:hypothetical protein B0T11DRAFT_298873 [Plectosphaerella cucumerina]|uniref:Uncharacterized protein n=1 Tax=Plectosphaerella cucumerina TaxID=40658 RepID=A0A8K0TK79_9PEZI|nr:hypothetical protein B0T11DRAFT_298873 [Plectosphaerella cucumerina]